MHAGGPCCHNALNRATRLPKTKRIVKQLVYMDEHVNRIGQWYKKMVLGAPP